MQSLDQIQWPGWEVVRLIGRGSFGAVYEIERDLFGRKEKAALKHIGIPQNSGDIDEMYSDGYDEESISATFQSHLQSIVAEYSMMRKLNGAANVVNCDDVKYIQREDGFGWDIYIKMELLTPLTKALLEQIPVETTEKLAMDICHALVLCKRFDIVHRDIKPQNIFVSPLGDYKLGDFGIAKTVEKTMGGTKTGTYKYMAPEVYHNQPYGHQADIYSLGLVLYWMLNKKRMPFLPLPPAKLVATADEEARNRRLSGEPLPAPADGSDELKCIVLKACAYDPKERYHSAGEMLADLEAIVTGVRQERLSNEQQFIAKTSGSAERNDSAEFEDSTAGAFGVMPASRWTAHRDTLDNSIDATLDLMISNPKKKNSGDDSAPSGSKPERSMKEEKTLGEKQQNPPERRQEQDTESNHYSSRRESKEKDVTSKEPDKKKVGVILAAAGACLALAVAILIWKPWASHGGNNSAGHQAASQNTVSVPPTEKETTSDTSAGVENGETVPVAGNEIHRYEIITSDCSWTEAQQYAVQRGGYLVRLDSREEYEYVLDQINREAPNLSFLRIGMRRDESSTDYYWVDNDNRLYGPLLNQGDNWYSKIWLEGEPTLGWNGTQECYGLLQYSEKENRWGWNDSTDVLDNSFAGEQGYIVEYD